MNTATSSSNFKFLFYFSGGCNCFDHKQFCTGGFFHYHIYFPGLIPLLFVYDHLTKVLFIILVLDVHAFERLLGPCMDIMKRSIDGYEEQLKKLGIGHAELR